MPREGYKSVTIRKDDYDFFRNFWLENKNAYRKRGITSFAGFITMKLYEAIESPKLETVNSVLAIIDEAAKLNEEVERDKKPVPVASFRKGKQQRELRPKYPVIVETIDLGRSRIAFPHRWFPDYGVDLSHDGDPLSIKRAFL